METFSTWARLFELNRYYSWIVDRFHVSARACQVQAHRRDPDFSWLDPRLRAIGFRHVLCVRRPETFEAARAERRKVSGKPSQYDDLDRFVREQDLFRRLVAESTLPWLEVDVSDDDVAAAAERIGSKRPAACGRRGVCDRPLDLALQVQHALPVHVAAMGEALDGEAGFLERREEVRSLVADDVGPGIARRGRGAGAIRRVRSQLLAFAHGSSQTRQAPDTRRRHPLSRLGRDPAGRARGPASTDDQARPAHRSRRPQHRRFGVAGTSRGRARPRVGSALPPRPRAQPRPGQLPHRSGVDAQLARGPRGGLGGRAARRRDDRPGGRLRQLLHG